MKSIEAESFSGRVSVFPGYTIFTFSRTGNSVDISHILTNCPFYELKRLNSDTSVSNVS